MKRLSGWDAVLLYSETPNVHMHTIKVAVIELDEDSRGFDIDAFRQVIAGRMDKLEPLGYQLIDVPPITRQRSTGDTSGQSGDLQGLSNSERADSESVDELIEEGNAFEAGIVSGVEDADNADEKEVHTHEVPEDDVPSEYLDEE